MNRDDIIRIAREAGFVTDEADFIYPPKTPRRGIGLEIERVIVLAAAAERERLTKAAMSAAKIAIEEAMELEREACAKICDGWASYGVPAVAAAAQAIRARGEQEQPR